MSKPQSELEASYDRVAEHYADEFLGELERKSFDREVLNEFAKNARNLGAVCEIGCGPGQIARYLKDGGVDVYGVDLSVGQIKVTRALKDMHRALKPGGILLVSFHGGTGELHRDYWYETPVSIDVTLLGKDEMTGYLEAAGLEVERIVEQEPYEFEYPVSCHAVSGPSNETFSDFRL